MSHTCYSHHQFLISRKHLYSSCLHMYVYNAYIVHARHVRLSGIYKFSLAVNSSSPIITVTMFPMSSLLLVGTASYLVMFSVAAFSGSGWLRGRDRVTEPLAWLMARDWTASAVKSAINLHSININSVPLSGVARTVGLSL